MQERNKLSRAQKCTPAMQVPSGKAVGEVNKLAGFKVITTNMLLVTLDGIVSGGRSCGDAKLYGKPTAQAELGWLATSPAVLHQEWKFGKWHRKSMAELLHPSASAAAASQPAADSFAL